MEPTTDTLCYWCGVAPCEWELYEEDLWLTAGRIKRKLRGRKHQNRVLRQTLGRIYIYKKTGSLCGAIPKCAAKKLKQYWPDPPRNVSGSSVDALQSTSNVALN
ncbi:hypothetical protein F444_22716 [Phytophthora nicotianae P1976]|uniref:Uncharacterized protein n=1 Tax=Phytophthora nicotianae P1976 TaxID=1317066 RepID=A0A080YWZ6_PHYNI|nr:hypothetical protein F444_22716 [Phytophthora nicotianae P1976]